jgi:hypothetical protein
VGYNDGGNVLTRYKPDGSTDYSFNAGNLIPIGSGGGEGVGE